MTAVFPTGGSAGNGKHPNWARVDLGHMISPSKGRPIPILKTHQQSTKGHTESATPGQANPEVPITSPGEESWTRSPLDHDASPQQG